MKARVTWASSRAITSSAVALITFLAGARLAPAETPLDRGDYLVNVVMACDGCHTPRGPDGSFAMEKRFSGGSQICDEPTFLVKGMPNHLHNPGVQSTPQRCEYFHAIHKE